MGPTIPGTRSTDEDTDVVLLDLRDGLDFLNQEKDGVKFLKRIGTNGFTYANQKHQWDETVLATREETVTIAAAGTNPITVANAYQYQVNGLLRCENEIMRITAIASATTLTVTRGYAGTTAAAHSAKLLYSLGPADPEGADAPAGINNAGDRMYNYSQTFTRAVSLTNDDIAELTTQGNDPLNKELEMRLIELHRELARAVIYGIRYEDTTNKVYAMGGTRFYIATNVYNVGGAVSVAAIDLAIFDILKAGGDPKLMCMHPKQKQKIDALDASLVRLGLKDKGQNVGGNPQTMEWKSGLLDHPIDILTDWTFLDSELHIYDTDYLEVGHKSHNGVVGNFHVVDSTTKGADRQDRAIRGKYSLRIRQEKAHAVLYALT